MAWIVPRTPSPSPPRTHPPLPSLFLAHQPQRRHRRPARRDADSCQDRATGACHHAAIESPLQIDVAGTPSSRPCCHRAVVDSRGRHAPSILATRPPRSPVGLPVAACHPGSISLSCCPTVYQGLSRLLRALDPPLPRSLFLDHHQLCRTSPSPRPQSLLPSAIADAAVGVRGRGRGRDRPLLCRRRRRSHREADISGGYALIRCLPLSMTDAQTRMPRARSTRTPPGAHASTSNGHDFFNL